MVVAARSFRPTELRVFSVNADRNAVNICARDRILSRSFVYKEKFFKSFGEKVTQDEHTTEREHTTHNKNIHTHKRKKEKK